jgi:hypothetical protein
VVWFFARGDDAVRVETRFDKSAREFILEITRSDKTVDTQRFSDRAAFQTRLNTVEAELKANAWEQVSAELLPAAWRGPFTN